MTEAEWLSSVDPAAMLAWLCDKASDRKLRLFAAACCRRIWPLLAERKAQAAILRDLIGNPFRPAVIVMTKAQDWAASSGNVAPEWLTQDVVLLAGRAYDDRPGRKCDDRICRGRGRWTDAAGDMDDCQRCAGTGTIDDGTLDPLTLAVLADALEEAGCPADEECRRCGGHGWLGKIRFVAASRTRPCDMPECSRGRIPHPLLAHLRSPGPHYRGCWAIDLLLGKG